MKIYSHYGFNDFIICLGFKGYLIKEFFNQYSLRNSDYTIDFTNNNKIMHRIQTENWKVTLVDTGEESMTGGRLLRLKNYLKDEEDFCLTYGDGLSNVNITELVSFHKTHKKVATVTAVTPPGRFGALQVDGIVVKDFHEKPIGDGNMINGGFFVFNNSIFEYLKDDNTILEQEPLVKLSQEGELCAFKHFGFWRAMDSLNDKRFLEDLVTSNKAEWILW